MKIKPKKAFGEKHRLRRQQRRANAVQDPDQDPKVVAADKAGHTTSGATWREKITRLSLLQGYANAACLAAEAFGDESAQNVAHVAYGDAEDALRRLTEEHLPEIEADYDKIWAALEAERKSDGTTSVDYVIIDALENCTTQAMRDHRESMLKTFAHEDVILVERFSPEWEQLVELGLARR